MFYEKSSSFIRAVSFIVNMIIMRRFQSLNDSRSYLLPHKANVNFQNPSLPNGLSDVVVLSHLK